MSGGGRVVEKVKSQRGFASEKGQPRETWVCAKHSFAYESSLHTIIVVLCFAGYIQVLAKGKRFARIRAQYILPSIRGGVVCHRNRLGIPGKCVANMIFNMRNVQIDGS